MSARQIDFTGRAWTAHAQDHWLEFAGNPNFPDYLRIVFVAYGRHSANGHAKLNRGELVRFLVRKDGTMPDRRNVHHSIAHAIDLGYLLPESRMLCLVVSSHDVQGGVGDPKTRCNRDHTTRPKAGKSRTNDVNGLRRSQTNDVSETGRSPLNDVTDIRRSTLNPSSLLQPVRQDRETTTSPQDGRTA